MTRGKYAERADKTRAVVSAHAETVRLTHENTRLEATLRDLMAETIRDREAHKATLQDLHAQIAAGSSAALEEALAVVTTLREEMGALRLSEAKSAKLRSKMIDRVHDHFKSAHGMTPTEALEAVVEFAGEGAVTILDNESQKRLGAEGVRAVQRARGDRR